MSGPTRSSENTLEARVVRAAEGALADHSYVSVLDVLCNLGFLAPRHVDDWRKGRIDVLESTIQANPVKVASALAIFREWAARKGMAASEARYQRQMRTASQDLRFTAAGDPEIEKSYRMHYIPASLSERKRQGIEKKLEETPKTVVFQVVRDSQCSECGAAIPEGEFLLMEADQPLCMPCAGLGALEFLPSGDTALTRRATKYAERMAVVVRHSRSRNRYERQGILADPVAIERAERDCRDDADDRAAARTRAAGRRREDDKVFAARMAAEIRELFPGCPPAEAEAIAAHTAERGSGRVGRSAAGRRLDEQALALAVVAAVRHGHTNYDELLANGVERSIARERVRDRIDAILDRWRE